MRENIALALSAVAGLDAVRFAADWRTVYAVTRCLEIISEASRRLDPAIRMRHPALPWRQIADAGNVYRHAYDGVRPDLLLRTVTEELPPLLAAIEAELARTPDPGAPPV